MGDVQGTIASGMLEGVQETLYRMGGEVGATLWGRSAPGNGCQRTHAGCANRAGIKGEGRGRDGMFRGHRPVSTRIVRSIHGHTHNDHMYCIQLMRTASQSAIPG